MNANTLSLRSLQTHLKVAIVALCMAAALFAMPHPAQSDGPIGVGSGTSVMLSWITSNVNECRITSLPDTGQWRGGVDVGSTGSQSTGPISGTVTYRPRCTPVSGAAVVSH